MQWIIDGLKIELEFFKYKIINGIQTEKQITEAKAKANDLERAITILNKSIDLNGNQR